MAEELFGGWGGVMVRACLEGAMGEVLESPSARGAAAVLGDFAFLAGEPDRALLERLRADILVPRTAAWAEEIKGFYGPRSAAFERYAFSRAPEDREVLWALAVPPGGYELRAMDEELWGRCLEREWSRDLAAQLGSWERFGKMALGVLALSGGELCAGASSYAACRGAIEIEVDTRPDRRRRGLARCCAANLVLRCLELGIYPEWDAHTPASAALAESLGYGGRRPYTAFAIRDTEAEIC